MTESSKIEGEILMICPRAIMYDFISFVFSHVNVSTVCAQFGILLLSFHKSGFFPFVV